MIHAQIAGKLFRDPQSRTSKAGKTFAIATVKAGHGDDMQFVRILAFGDHSTALLELRDGDGVSAVGTIKAEAYLKDGEPRASMTLLADRVLALRAERNQRRREREAERATDPNADSPRSRQFAADTANPRPAADRDLDDRIPF